MIRETPPDNKDKIIHKSIEMVLYFPILILKIGKKINEFISLFIKKAKDLDFYFPFFNAKNREENLFIKNGEGSIFFFPTF